jgi:site-specific recombinase XerD
MASIREHTLSNGERTWRVLYRHGKRQTSKTFVTPAAAQDFKAKVDLLGPDRALAMLLEDEANQGVTVAELAADFFAWKARDVEPRTIEDYTRDFDNWVDPFLGHRAAALVTEGDVQEWVDKHLSSRLGPKSVADRHALLHGIYKWASAKARGHVPHNPCMETELPKRKKGAPKGLTIAEWVALREAAARLELSSKAKGAGKDAADLILFMGSTGWRIGEAVALTCQAVEDAGGVVWVTMSQVSRKGVGIAQGGKSLAAERRIDVWGDCAAMLRRRIVGKGPGDLVFTNPASPTGLWEPSTFRNRYWAAAVKAAGLTHRKPTPHWLRHTHVALCLAAGMDLAQIQRRVGHENIQTTINVYGRMQADTAQEVRDRLEAVMQGKTLPVVGEVVRGEVE